MLSQLPESSVYNWVMLAAVVVSMGFWVGRVQKDSRLLAVFLGGLVGAFLGAKLIFFLAEGYQYLAGDRALEEWLGGKSILGALLGGYLGVELGKKLVRYHQPTGDWFAAIAPFSIALGRLGCLAYGCCRGEPCDKPTWYCLAGRDGVARWPAVPVEILFNLMAAALLLLLRNQKRFRHQHFHLYLISYGVFRFFHEMKRDTPPVLGSISGYQVVAVGLVIFGGLAYYLRAREQAFPQS